jgi:hypothetical protein
MVDLNIFQRVGDFFEQRREYRAQALVALRKREGLPSPVDKNGNELETRFDDCGNVRYYNASGEVQEHVLFAGSGRNGKPGSFAVGTRKQESSELADASWHSDSEFQILDVAEDGTKLSDELKDLDRDSGKFEIAERVSFGAESEMAPGFKLAGTSDEEIDETLQKFLKRGLR